MLPRGSGRVTITRRDYKRNPQLRWRSWGFFCSSGLQCIDEVARGLLLIDAGQFPLTTLGNFHEYHQSDSSVPSMLVADATQNKPFVLYVPFAENFFMLFLVIAAHNSA